jgi:ankyrin repeat protein
MAWMFPRVARRLLPATACALLSVTLTAADDVPIAIAAMNRDTTAVRALVTRKVDVNAVGSDGTSALLWTVRAGDVETAALLIKAGADVKLDNRLGATPLALATANGDAAIVRLLVDAGADVNAPDVANETPLMSAARSGSVAAVQVLLDKGAAIEARAAGQQSPLMIAVRENRPAVVKLLVSKGAEVNARTRVGNPPNWVLPNSVAGFGHGVGIVRGGLPPRGSRAPTPGGLTPLLYAARDGRVEMVRDLLAAGADIEGADANAITPLLIAITNNHPDVARALIEKGANIKATDWYGRTPLWTAVETRNMDVDNADFQNRIDRAPFLGLIQLLLEKGAVQYVR